MKIKIDHREHDLIQSCKYFLGIGPAYQGIELEICNLPIGDIILCDDTGIEKVIIERKSLSDLASSIKDGRYEEQSYRLNGISHPNHNIMYIIEGEMNKVNSFKQPVNPLLRVAGRFHGGPGDSAECAEEILANEVDIRP